MEKLSLYSKIKTESAKFSGAETFEKWNHLGRDQQKELRDRIIKFFKSEQTELWASVALVLGKLATWDRISEDYLQIFIISITNLHRYRRAFTAIGAYTAALEEDKQFAFLNRYKDITILKDNNGFEKKFDFKKLKETICKTEWGDANKDKLFKKWGVRESIVNAMQEKEPVEKVNKYFESIIKITKKGIISPKILVSGAKHVVSDFLCELSETQLLKEQLKKQFKEVKGINSVVRIWWEEEGKNNLDKKLENQINGRKKSYDKNPDDKKKEIINKLENIKRMAESDDLTISLSEVIEQTGTNVNHIVRRKNVLSIDSLENWVFASFMLSFPEALNIAGDNYDLSAAMGHLIAKNDLVYVKNIPFILNWQHEKSGQWKDTAKQLIEAIKNDKIKHDDLHSHEFLTDIIILYILSTVST